MILRNPRVPRSMFVLGVFLSISVSDTRPLAARLDGVLAPRAQGSADAYVIEELTTRYQFQDDGSGERLTRARIVVNDQAGVAEWSTLMFTYVSATEQVSLRRLAVHKMDGRNIEASSLSLDDVTAPGQIDTAILSDLRAKRVVVPALQPGDRLIYEAAVRSSASFIPGQFWADHSFRRGAAVKSEVFEIDVPAQRRLNVSVRRGAESSDGAAAPGRRVRRWTHSQSTPPKLTATELARLVEDVKSGPDIRISSFENWDQLAAWFGSVIDRRAQPSEAITSRARELTRGLGTPQQRLQALYTFVSTEIRYVSLALGAGRLEPRPAVEVLATQYGDCKDKHVLLASLARAIDIDLKPVLISSMVTVDDRVPSPTQFDHLITVRTSENAAEWEWMDTTSGVLPAGALFSGFRNTRALLITGNGPERGSGASAAFITTPADIGFPTTTTVDISGTIDEKALTTRVVRRLTGDLEFLMRLAFRETDNNLRVKVAEEQAKEDGLSKGTIQDVSFKDEGAGRGVEFTYRASHPFSFTYDKPWQIWIPSPTLELPATPDEPGTPIKLGTPLEVIVSASYEVPPALRVRPPVAVTLDREFATYRSTYAVDGRILRVQRRLRTLLKEVPPDQAESYRTFSRAIDTDVRQRFSVDPIARTASSPVTADELNAAGSAAIDRRQYKEAIDLLTRATALDPEHKYAWNNLGRAYNAVNEYQNAMKALERQIAVNPFDQYAYANFGRSLWGLKRTDEAIAQYKKQLEIVPLDRWAHRDLGRIYAELKRYDEAAASLERAVAVAPKDELAWESLARVRLARGDADAAVVAFDRAFELTVPPGAFYRAARELAENGVRLDAAERFARNALVAVTKELGGVPLEQLRRQHLEAMRFLPLYWDNLGWIYLQTGRLAEAERWLNAAWLLGQEAVIGEHLGLVREKLGDRARAIDAYAQARAVDSERPASLAALERLVGAAKVESSIRSASKAQLEQRAVQIPLLVDGSAAGEVTLIADRMGRITSVRLEKGSDRLRGAIVRLKGLRTGVATPDEQSIEFVRQANIVCGPQIGCVMYLIRPVDVRPTFLPQ